MASRTIACDGPTTDEFSLVIGRRRTHRRRKERIHGAMLIYSMSVSVDGFIADREGAFEWAAP